MCDNIRSYDRISKKWDEYRHSKPVDPCIRDISGLLSKGSSILDIGCGTGYPIDKHLSDSGFRITGIDPSEEMIRLARSMKLPDAVFYITDLFSFKSADQFDAVIAFDSLWHIEFQMQKDIFPAVSKLLKPRGLFLFTSGKTSGSVSGQMFGESFSYHSLDRDVIKDCLQQSGFSIKQFTEDYSNEISGTRDLLVIARKD